ncbi:MAG: YabP/YqfC family sporulation protein [Clostridia bacterium]|nr:YabP/YqfC family sporulation protein [Clostridia bacterium]
MNIIAENFGYKITFYGGKELMIEGHKGLSEYGENEISIRVRGGKIIVKGERLYIDEINHEEISIRGNICSIGVEK